jgi:hypothetical protein
MIAACDGGTEPEPPAVEGLLFAEPVSYRCGRWIPAPPDVDSALFDVEFAMTWPLTGPSEDQRERILRAAGRIVYEFHVPTIRAVLAPTSVPQLEAYMVRGVTDSLDFDVPLSTYWTGTDSVAYRRLIEDLGGHVRGSTWAVTTEPDLDSTFAMSVDLPDGAIPTLQARPEVAGLSGRPPVACDIVQTWPE